MPVSIELILQEFGLRATPDRKAIYALFMQNRAWSARQIHKKLPTMNLSTTYRNLQKFTRIGLLHEVPVPSSEGYFERADMPHHDHVICNECERVECISCPIEALDAHYLQLIRTCSACNK